MSAYCLHIRKFPFFVSVFLLGVFLFYSSSVFSATPSDSLQSVYARQAFFGKAYPQERVYAHLDKPYYQLGDHLFYKIYATMGQGLFPDTLSKTLYVELLDASGVVLQSQKKLMNFGLSFGSMELSVHYAPGVYRLRAFTSWMRNFRTDPLFEQFITIYGSLKNVYNWHMSTVVNEGPELDTLHLTLHLTDSLYRGVSSPYEFLFNGKGIDRVKGSMTTGADGSNRMSLLIPKSRKSGLGQLILTVGGITQQKEVILATQGVLAQFFPEGGQWVSGINSRVAFKITDEKGVGLPCKGVIRNSKGEEVVRFESQHRGMGTFRMSPLFGEVYTAELSLSGESSLKIPQVFLPVVQPMGYVMEIEGAAADSVHIYVRRAGIAREEMLGLMLQTGGQVLWHGNLRMHGDSSKLTISKASLPTGISQFTLYRADGTPVSERLVFVNRGDALKVEITSPVQQLKPREKVSLDLKVTDVRGIPVQGSFSLAVTDRSQVSDTAVYAENILTYLLLSSEVRGKIEDPGYYFEADTQEKREALEYLLLTQGWRRYRWDMALPDTLPKMEYAVERGITISGTIRNITTKKAVGGREVTLLLQHKEAMDGASYTTNETGRFKFVTDFFGEAKVNIQTKYRNRTIEQAIDLDKNEFSFDEVAQGASGTLGENEAGDALSQRLSQTQAAVDEYQKAQEAVRVQRALTDSLLRTIALDEVEVTARWNEKIEITKQADTVLVVRDALESVRDDLNFAITDIEQFLLNTYPERFKEECKGDSCLPRYFGSGSEGGTGTGSVMSGRPLCYLVNGWIIPRDQIVLDNVNCYSKVEIIDQVGAAMRFGGSLDDVVIALTRNPDGMCLEQHIGVRNYKMQGYAVSKEFFSPDYEKDNSSLVPDVRSTLFWAPHVQTDAGGRGTVTFFNSDRATKIGVNVQGVATSGTVGAGVGRAVLGF